ncbi:MAG TPA: ATP-binding domain-containing protein [Mycobacteriales bacterium]|jgi:DNA helicase IV|nr:ATP-binding domain-containing protein [Mycobacteriales bacterium]
MSRAGEIARERDVVAELYARLDQLRDQTRERLTEVRRRGASGTPQARSERDAFAALYEDRLAQLEAVEPGLCFGRLDLISGERLHVGRIGLTDERHDTMLVDWRAPAAEPFYRATPASPHGVSRRRHLRTRGRAVLDIEDDVFDVSALSDDDRETLGGGGALLAALTASRTGRMRDIVATIQDEQDRVIRADPAGVLVVQGGPGTGKTAVALHRAAYLLYTHRERLARSGVLVVGPGPAFLRYIEQVLPSLGETGVLLSTLDRLLPDVEAAGTEPDDVAAVKADLRMAEVIAAAIAARQRIPDDPVTLEFEDLELVLTPADIATARSRARRTRRRHNRARYAFAKHLLRLLVGRIAEVNEELARERGVVRELMVHDGFRALVDSCWPRLTAEELVRDLLSEDGMARAGAALNRAERRLLVRDPQAPWCPADVPLIDEAWARLGDPDEMLRVAAGRRAARADRAYAQQVISERGLAGQVDAARLAERFGESATGGGSVAERAAGDPDWEFGHVIVDEAQELSPMAWRMLARRCPDRSMTVVGDLAQASAPWGATDWQSVLDPIASGRITVRELTVNYRTPAEVMAVAADVLAAVDAGRQPPSSVRDAGHPPYSHQVPEGGAIDETVGDVVAQAWAAIGDGKLAVICPPGRYDGAVAEVTSRLPTAARTGADGLDAAVAVLDVTEAKGLEFDAVVLVEPADWVAAGDRGLRDLYVALTRTTQRLDVVHSGPLPDVLADLVPWPAAA